MAGILEAGDGVGIRPRPAASDYPAQEHGTGLTIAAAVISPEQVRSMFATDLTRGYIVVELAVYPEAGQTVDLSPADFMLKIGADGESVRSVNARAIASAIQRKNTPKQSRASDIVLYPTATIGYESGPSYDSGTGRRRSGGVYTGAGVGIATGNGGGLPTPAPGSTDRDRVTMQQELEDKGLPEGVATKAVAGYLYFPRPSGKQRNGVYEITYLGTKGKVRLVAQPGKR